MTDWLSLAADPTPFISLICLALAAAGLLWGACWRHTATQTAERAERLRSRAKAAENRCALLEDTVAERDRQLAEAFAMSDEWALREHHHLIRCLGSRVEVGDMECN